MRKFLFIYAALVTGLQGCSNPNIPKDMTPAEAKVYHRAIQQRSQGSEYDAKMMVKTHKGIIFHLPQKTCVLLVPNSMGTGWTYAVCYDDKTGALTDNEAS